MSKRIDILKLFRGENPEFVPWFGDLAYWIDYLTDEDKMPKKYLKQNDAKEQTTLNQGLAGSFYEEGLQQLHRDCGVGFYLQGYFPFRTTYHNMKVEYKEDSRYRITKFETPYGNLKEVWEYIKSTYSWAPKEMLVKGIEDIAPLKYIYENTTYEPDYALAIHRKQSVGENGVALVYTPKTPLMELVALKAGIETVMDLYLDAEEEFEELLEVMCRKHSEAVNIAIECPSDCIMVPDNLSSELVGGNLYSQFIRPVHKNWIEQIRLSGKKSFVHLDGTLTPLLTELSKVGFDIIEAVTPKPVGDVELEELRSKVEPETIIWGGIPGGFFTSQLTDEEFDTYVIKVIKLMKNNNRFVLGVADQVVATSSFERVKRVGELVLEYGKYDN